ncbi:MAG TPA: hypothetical protein VEX60_17750 [Pyrinomonadaceae bacterium]|nr:hypothetical protein [Pyrinomonadaceae bacterium]
MSDNLGDGTMTGERKPLEIQSPTDKIEGQPAEGSPLPGAENPDSQEVKEEVNPNTE